MIALAQATQPTILETVSLVASIVSLVTGVVAIWLSLMFYKWSNDSQKEAKKAVEGITSAVQRLETLFDKLHSETFGMMKDMVTDMRTRIFPPGGKLPPKPRSRAGQQASRAREAEDEAEDTPPQHGTGKPTLPSSRAEAERSSEEGAE